MQGLINIGIGRKTEFEILGNYSANRFDFRPEDRSTSTGVVNNVVRLDVFFDGQEIDRFKTGMVGASILTRPNDSLGLKWMVSGYRALEDENFDIIGDYWLGAVESNLGEEDFGEIAFGLGVGTFQNFARNRIDSWVGNVGHRGYFSTKAHYLEWGARFQREEITDRINDWERLDSAGYSLPFSDTEVLIADILKSTNEIASNRYSAFVQNTWMPTYSGVGFALNTGVRASYWDLNGQFLVSPRVQASLRPPWLRKDGEERDVVFKAAVGHYAQPPFYRELRNVDGRGRNGRPRAAIHPCAGRRRLVLRGIRRPAVPIRHRTLLQVPVGHRALRGRERAGALLRN